MKEEHYSSTEVDFMHINEVNAETVQVLRQAKSINARYSGEFSQSELKHIMQWPSMRYDIWGQLLSNRWIVSTSEVATSRTKWAFTPEALDYCRRFQVSDDRPWLRNCKANFDEHTKAVTNRLTTGRVPGKAILVNGKRIWFVFLPNGAESLILSINDGIKANYDNETVTRTEQKKVRHQITHISAAEKLAQGKPSDVMKMLKPFDTAKALWVRAKCKLYEKERRLPESIIQEAREILGIFGPSCVSRFGYSQP